MTEMVGPLGFTDMDPEGMLTWGFDQLGTMPTIYNYPYYPEHMEHMGGWEKDNDYVEYKLYVPEQMPEKYSKVAQMIQKRYNLHIKKFRRNDFRSRWLRSEDFRRHQRHLHDLYGYSELSQQQIDHYIKTFLPLLDLNLVTLIEDWNTPDHKLVGVGITMPSLSPPLQKCRRGRLFPSSAGGTCCVP